MPISLATVSLPPAASAETIASSAVSRYGDRTASAAANAARPVFAMALPGPRRPPRSSAMPRTALRLRPSREDTAATKNEANSSVHPPMPVKVKTTAPMIAPVTAPVGVTVSALHPSAATGTFTTSAPRNARGSQATAAAHDPPSISARPPITIAAEIGTEMLSSRPIGIVSANAATIAAATGAQTMNSGGGGGVTAVRVHQASAIAAAPPASANAAVPATVLPGFHGSRGPRLRDPTMAAALSPKARIAQHAAATSGRRGNARMRSRTESG